MICEKIKELHPELNPKIANVRWAMKSEAFTPNGRTGIYGVKKWIKEGDLHKEGTIRKIVEEYLTKFSAPRHIFEIAEEVLKYRPRSNKHSILVNLRKTVCIKAIGTGYFGLFPRDIETE